MARYIAFAILAVLATNALAASYPSVTSSSFNSTPTAVWDSTSSSDTYFVNTTGTPIFGAGSSNDTAYVWIANWSASATNIPVLKRTLNATAVASAASSGLTTKDETISTTAQGSAVSGHVTGLGYFAFCTVNATGTDGKDQLYLHIIGTSANSVKLTTNTDTTISYAVHNTWMEDGYFYVVFSSMNATASMYLNLYAQAVAYNGTTLYSTPQSIATINSASLSLTVAAKAINATASDYFLVVYKYLAASATYKATYAVLVNRTSGAAGTATTVATDSATLQYTPSGVIGSKWTYGAVVGVWDNSTGTVTYYLNVYYNGTYSNSTKYSPPTNYGTGVGTTGMKYVEGYGVMFRWMDTTVGDNYQLVWTTYYANGTQNTTATLGNFDTAPSSFVDANGTLWLGYYSSNSSNTASPLLKGYLAKLAGQVNAANILASVFAFLSLLIAALFAF